MFKKLKAALSRRRKNAAANSALAGRSASRTADDTSSPLHPLNPVGIHSPLHPINQAAYSSDPEPTRCSDDSHRSSWGGGSDCSSSGSSWSSSDSSGSSSSSSSCD